MLLLEGKNLRIFGFSYGICGDLIMSLPMLTYYEKKYPGSYKIFAIEKKMGYMAPFFLNHPLIDRIHITENWNGFGKKDYELAASCYIKCTMDGWKHSCPDWYNYVDCIEETAYIAGVDDLLSVCSKDDLYPKLEQWFDIGSDDPNFQTYSKQNSADISVKDNTIAIWPFATSARNVRGRNPSVLWYNKLMVGLHKKGYEVYQFGYKNDVLIKGTIDHTKMTFFDQVRLALSTRMSIGTDSGVAWLMGAYSHPAIHLMTNWLRGHSQNWFALAPANKKSSPFFHYDGCDNIKHDSVLEEIERIMKR